MLNSNFTSMIRDDIKMIHLLFFVFIIGAIGIIINHFERYPLFYILFFVLLFMFLLTIVTLKVGLERLQQFKKQYNEYLKKELNIIYSEKENVLIPLLLLMMILIYFVCLYQLGYFEINLMGIYILFLGGGTFFIALISYEMYIKILMSLYKLAKNKKFCQEISQIKECQEPLWLQNLFLLSKSLRNASLFIGIFFVFENSMIFIANYDVLIKQNIVQKSANLWWQNFDAMPLEFWIIWIFVFVSIGVAFPIMAFVQTQFIKKVVFHIQDSFKMKVFDINYESVINTSPCTLYTRLLIMQYIDDMLEKNFFPHKADKFITIVASLLTSIIHITSLFALFFTK